MTRKYFIAGLCSLALAASCQKAELQEIEQGQTDVPMVDAEFVSVAEKSLTEAPASKLNIALDLKTYWTPGDEIAVYDGKTLNPFFVHEIDEANPSEASFVGKMAEGSTEFHALYPYSAAESFADGKFIANIPAVQTVAGEGMADPNALLAVAHLSGEGKFAFRNVCGLIKVNVPEGGISQIIIEGAKGEALAGKGTVTVSDAPVFTASEEASTTVTLLPAGGEGKNFAAGDYYAAVAPVLFEEGFKITLVRLDSRSGVTSTDQKLEVVRNGGLYLTDAVTSFEWKWVIMNKEQLLAWNERLSIGSAGNQATWYADDYVELGADIDMDGAVWIPGNLFGTFDGKGHKIYNLVVDTKQEGHPDQKYASFITYNFGTLKNLIIGSKDGETYDGKSMFLHDPQADDGAWAYVGLVGKVSGAKNQAGESVVGKIQNVKNFAKLIIPEGTSKIKFAVGGIASMLEATGATVEGCVNHGDIEILNTGEPAAKTCVIGGLVGKFDYEGAIINCENRGNITNEHIGVRGIGGIIGDTNAKPLDITPTIKGTDNYGAIYLNNSVTEIFAGGIVGRFVGGIIDDCENNGEFHLFSEDVKLYYGGIAGRFVNDIKTEAGAWALTKESKILNCKNNASALFKCDIKAVAGNDIRLAGMFNTEGNGTAALTLSGCHNYAPFTISHPKIRCLGGIGGGVAAKTMPVTITDCHNHGALTVDVEPQYATAVNYAGIVGLFYGYGVDNSTVTGCTNNGAIVDKMTGTGDHNVAGIIGHLQFGVKISSCTNNARIESDQAVGRAVLGGIVGHALHDNTIEECTNNGDIAILNSAKTKIAAGIIAYDEKTNNGASVTDCVNNGSISAGSTAGDSYVSGIAAYARWTIKGCTNNGAVSLTSTAGGNLVAGIVASATSTSTIEECVNDVNGTVTVDYNKTSVKATALIGGVAGSCSAKKVYKCENKAAVNVAHHTKDGYSCTGGLVGRAAGTTIEECINHSTGTVTAALTTTNQLAAAGGVLGDANGNVTLKNNANHALVSGSTTKSYIYVGGVLGSDCEGDLHVTTKGAKSITGNKNYGSVRATADAAPADNTKYYPNVKGTGVAAGGLFGITAQSYGIEADNSNYGNVSATANGLSSNAGAAAGVCNTAADWACNVGQGVTVNGVAWSESVDASWICPMTPKTITATYVEQPTL